MKGKRIQNHLNQSFIETLASQAIEKFDVKLIVHQLEGMGPIDAVYFAFSIMEGLGRLTERQRGDKMKQLMAAITEGVQ